MGVRQLADASRYGLCQPCYEGLALGALNAWTHRLLNVWDRVGSGNALNHWTNIVCLPDMGVRQLADASSYGLCSPCCAGLALGAPNAWTHRLLDVVKRTESEKALNH